MQLAGIAAVVNGALPGLAMRRRASPLAKRGAKVAVFAATWRRARRSHRDRRCVLRGRRTSDAESGRFRQGRARHMGERVLFLCGCRQCRQDRRRAMRPESKFYP